MKQSDFIELIATENDISVYKAKKIFASIGKIIIKHLVNREAVPLFGIGKIECRGIAARNGVSPSSGERIVIKAHTRAKFRASLKLKRSINHD